MSLIILPSETRWWQKPTSRDILGEPPARPARLCVSCGRGFLSEEPGFLCGPCIRHNEELAARVVKEGTCEGNLPRGFHRVRQAAPTRALRPKVVGE